MDFQVNQDIRVIVVKKDFQAIQVLAEQVAIQVSLD